MNFTLTEEQGLLKDQVRSLLSEQATPESLRDQITRGSEWNPDLWRTMAGLGLLGAAIPEAYGGVGLGMLDLCVISEELGRAVAPVPFYSSICLAAEAIALAGNEEQKARWLPALAAGETVATLAWWEGNVSPLSARQGARLDGKRLSGRKSPVSDLGIADIAVVIARDERGPRFAVVELSQDGVRRTPLDGFDQLRHHGILELDDMRCEPLTGPARDALDRLLERVAVFVAFEQLGGAEAALYMARDYTMDRYIFGRQLASYQAVKHKLADILVMTELSRANALYAAGAIEDGQADTRTAAANARLCATGAYEKAARENLQLHGGIGFTWEANCHFHYRRARLLALNLGSAEVWTDVLIDELARDVPAPAGA